MSSACSNDASTSSKTAKHDNISSPSLHHPPTLQVCKNIHKVSAEHDQMTTPTPVLSILVFKSFQEKFKAALALR